MLDFNVPLPQRDRWSKNDFIFCVIGYLCDFQYLWVLPYHCLKFGGYVYLVAFILMYILIGMPQLFMKMEFGQSCQCGGITSFRKVLPGLEGIGYSSLAVGFIYLIAFINNVINCLRYLIASFSHTLPWENCDNDWNSIHCKEYTTSRIYNSSSPAMEYFDYVSNGKYNIQSVTDLEGLQLGNVGCMIALYIIAYIILWQGIKSSGLFARISLMFFYFVLCILLIAAFLLPGSINGIIDILRPNVNQLFTINFWLSILSNIFIMFGPKYCVIIAYSSYNNYQNDIKRDAFFIGSFNLAIILLTFMITSSFAGFLAHISDTDISEFITEGPRIAFILYARVFTKLIQPKFFSITFFLAFLGIGLNTVIGISEAILTGLSDEYTNVRKNRKKTLCVIFVVAALVGLVFCRYGSIHAINWYLIMIVMIPTISLTVLQIFVIAWIYDNNNFSERSRLKNVYKTICLVAITVFSLALFITTLYKFLNYINEQFNSIPHSMTYFGTLICLLIILLPVFKVLTSYRRLSKTLNKAAQKELSLQEQHSEEEKQMHIKRVIGNYIL